MQQTLTMPARTGHFSTNGVFVDAERWERRKREAAAMVERRLLTLREACEHFGLREADIASRH